jgi:hypothetical protein
MASGGYRAGAGRPKGSTKAVKRQKAPKAAPLTVEVAEKALETTPEGTPLAYMLGVMVDEGADSERRDRMAIAAAPYVHAKAADVKGGKKEERAESAESVAKSGRFSARTAPLKLVNSR